MNQAVLQRRSFLKLAGGTLAYFASGSLVYGSQLPKSLDGSVALKLAAELPPLDGVFVFDDAVCKAMASDFGNFTHKLPMGVLFPKSVADIQAIVKYASENNIKIAVRGHACSAYGQAQVKEGIVINTSDFNKIHWDSEDENVICAQVGATWHEVVNVSMERCKTPPVLPDTLFLTVGGTISVGGFGETSYRLGCIVDHVESLDVVTSSGDMLTCSSRCNADLFHLALAGMGQCGVIARARIRVVEAPRYVITREISNTTRANFLNDLEVLACEEKNGAIFGRLLKVNGKWGYAISATTWLNDSVETEPPTWLNHLLGAVAPNPKIQTYYDYVNRNTKSYLDGIKNGAFFIPHPYMSFFYPSDTAPELIDLLTYDPDANFGATSIPVYPMLTANFKQPLQKIPKGEYAYHIRIYRKAAVEGSIDHLKMLSVNTDMCVPVVLGHGGTIYPPHAPILKTQQWAAHYGPDWKKFVAAKGYFDPNGVFNPGAGIF